ncbi:MAG: peroxiredoxin [Spirochaetes bacterium]|nr:peroxiredoxin [Spirochaetota bacterium]
MTIALACSGPGDIASPPSPHAEIVRVPAIGAALPSLVMEAYHDGKITRINLADYRGKWVVLFFYPGDFTFVCPTELKELADYFPEFRSLGAEVLSISTDSAHVHRAWRLHEKSLARVSYPMLADRSGRLSRAMGVYNEGKGTAHRASFIVNPEGAVVAFEVHHDSIGRSADELLRKLSAAISVEKGGGGYCPAGWQPGEEMITPR